MENSNKSENGFIKDKVMNPVEFYNVLMRNIDKFNDKDKFIISRFLDKLSDSQEFEYVCKKKLSQVHYPRKNVSFIAKTLHCPIVSESNITDTVELCYSTCYFKYNPNEGNVSWDFYIGEELFLNNLSPNDALKIYKDINYAFIKKSNINN